MAITLAEAITQVRYVLNEASAVFWTDAEITAWIQEGTRQVSSKTQCNEADDDLTLVTNQLSYTTADETWIATCIAPYAAIYEAGSNKYKGLMLIHPKQIGNLLTFTSGDPKYYSFHNRTFYIWPLPTTAENGNDVLILYAAETDDITAISDEWQHLPVLWAQAKAYEKDRMNAQASALMQRFFSELNFDTNDKLNRPGESPRDVKTGAPLRGKTPNEPTRR
jgi:hypothetical protein